MKLQIRFSNLFGHLFANGRRLILFLLLIGVAVSATVTVVRINRVKFVTSHSGKKADNSEIVTLNTKSLKSKTSRALFAKSKSLKGVASVPEFQTVPPTIELEEEREGEAQRRVDWFYYQRAYPNAEIPVEAGFRMRQQLEQEEARLSQLRGLRSKAEAPEQQAVWAAIGPAPLTQAQTFGPVAGSVSGRVSAIALDPGYNGTTNQTVYVGAAQGGVWRSIDSGSNWVPLMDNQPSLAVGAIAIDPANANVIYVGTGEGNRSGDTYYGQGLLKSTDGGSTWTQITGPVSTTAPGLPSFINCSFNAIEIDPSNTSTIYAATNIGLTSGPSGGSGTVIIGNRGIWKSTDGGMNWRNLNPSNDTVDRSATDVLVDPRKPQRVFAAILNIGLFRSEQSGEPGTWTKLSGGLPNSDPASPTVIRTEISAGPPLPPSTESTLYVAFGDPNDDLVGIWRSTDGGNNWTKLTSPQSSQVNYNIAIAIDPTDANTVYYATGANSVNNGGTLYRSTNGGQNWSDLSIGDSSEGLHADSHAIVISPANRNTLFTGNDGGIWRTNNATSSTVTWRNLNPNLNITQFQSIALHPTNPNFIIGGTQDNGTNLFSGQLSWRHIRGGDGGFTLIDQSNPQVMYHTFFNQNNSGGQRAQIGPEISLNGGNTWSRRGCFGCAANQSGNFNASDRVGFYAPMALNTGFTGLNGNVIYFGTHRLYRSNDQGITWTGLGTSTDGFGSDLTKGTGRLSAIAAHPNVLSGQEIVWTAANDGSVQITTNAGAGANATFTNLTKAPLPNRFATDIALDQLNPQRAVVTFSGFNSVTASTPGHVFLTINQGQSWTDISGNLPDVPVTSAALDPTSPSTIYIGTDLGVFQTTNGGSTWERLGNGMPRVAAYMVRYQAATNTLFAATHGRGVYRLTTSRAVSTVSAASFSASAPIAAESIVAAFGTGLSIRTEIASTVPLPTVLAGTRVAVRDSLGAERLSPLFFVASTQVNYLIPAGTAPGTATVIITADDGTVSTGTVQISTVAPSLFAANSNGRDVAAGFALRIAANGAQTNEPINRFDTAQNKFVSVPIDLSATNDQVFGVLFGSGFRNHGGLANVSATVGGTPVTVQYAGPQGGFVGLDQLNLILPNSLAGRGEVDVVVTVSGKTANTLKLNIK